MESVKHRICIDARMINNSGIGVYIQHFVKAILADNSYSVILLGRQEEVLHHFPERNYITIEADFPIYSIQEQLKLPFLIPVCDLFWSPHYNVPILPIFAKRFLVLVPDVYHLAYYHTLSLAQKLYAGTVMNIAAQKADRVLTISDYSKSEIIRFTNIKPDKIRVIHLGINKSLFKRTKSHTVQSAVRNKYKIPDNFILFVGNVKPNKNLIALLYAYKILLDTSTDYYLVIVGKKEGFITGDQELFKQIDKNAELKRKIIFTEYVDLSDLPVLYSMAALFAFPSVYEGFGFPPLEAMGCGCPVVASNRASIPEICGDAALYVDPDDSHEFARALINVLTNESLRASLIQKGYEQVKKYDWHKAGQEFIKEIRVLV